MPNLENKNLIFVIFNYILSTFIIFNFFKIDIFNTLDLKLVDFCWFLLIVINLHNHFNILHQASHFQISKNKFLNNIIGSISGNMGGISFAEFKYTHNKHHAFFGTKKDPDKKIATTKPILFIPFKIWLHDIYFWKHIFNEPIKLKKYSIIEYTISRIVLILWIILFINNFGFQSWLGFWLLPVLTVGYLNGFYLFYLPHYLGYFEQKFQDKFESNFLYKLYLLPIQISRSFHHLHHKSIKNLTAYYPVTFFILKVVNGDWKNFYQNNLDKKFIDN